MNRPWVRRWLVAAIAVTALFCFICAIKGLFSLLFLSFIVAYIMHPAVDRLERVRFINRTTAMVICLLAVLLLFGVFLLVLLPQLIFEAGRFMDHLPQDLDRILSLLRAWLRTNLHVELPRTLGQVMEKLKVQFGGAGPEFWGSASNFVLVVFSNTWSAVMWVVRLLLVPFFAFFLLRDYAKVVGTVRDLIPEKQRPAVVDVFSEIDVTLARFLRGELVVMLVLGLFYSVALLIVGAPLSFGIGLLTGLLCIVPYVGFAIGLLLALLVSVLQGGTWVDGIQIVVAFFSVQVLDMLFVTPRILGQKVGLHPVWVILALLAGGELFGFLGVLLAVPVAAIVKILTFRAVDRYKQSATYRGSSPP